MKPWYVVQGLVLFFLFCYASPPGRTEAARQGAKKPLTLKEACWVLLRDLEIPKDSTLGKRLVAANLDYNTVTKTYRVHGSLEVNLIQHWFQVRFLGPAEKPNFQPWIHGRFYWKKGQWTAETLN
jgi:hypothetical protein